MKTKKTTLSFLTESKASHVSLLSIRRVAITLLVMLLTTASAWAQVIIPKIYRLYLHANYQGCAVAMVEVPISVHTTYTLTSVDEPTREGYIFCGWSTSSTGDVQYRTNDKITLTGNTTLYAIWDKSYTLTLDTNYEGADSKTISVSSLNPTYTLSESVEPTRADYTFLGWSTSSTGAVQYRTNDIITLTGNQTLYAVWYKLRYTITNEELRQARVLGYEGGKPAGALNIPATTIINGTEYSVASIGGHAFQECSSLESVTIPNSVTSIGSFAFENCSSLRSVTLNSNPKIGAFAFYETPATVTMNLTASNVNGDKWTTFYNDGYNFQPDENTTLYKATVDGSSLVLTEVADGIVNSGTAVILKSTDNPVMTLTNSGSSDTNGNDLRGISKRTLRSDVISNISGADAIYTMGNTSVGFGFHRYTGEYVPAQKAFLPLNTSNEAKAQSLSIVFAIGTTGIKSVSSDSNEQNDWFSLDGTRLSGKPSQPGIYVNGKKKVVIK